MVDHDLLQAAINAYLNLDRSGRVIDEAMEAALEAYEAAKWRPISEAPDVRPDIMVWFPTPTDPYQPWMMLHGRDCWAPDKEAMFRTIDPPKQDAAHEPQAARHQPMEDKSSAM